MIAEEITKEELLSKLRPVWFERIPGLETRAYWHSIVDGINESFRLGHPAMPALNRVFYALNEFDEKKFRVLIIGQDPYPTAGVPNGLAFASNPDTQLQKSLRIIFKEIDDEYGSDMVNDNSENGSLLPWLRQGVMLLNTVLTIGLDYYPHKTIGWQLFTNEVIQWLDVNFKFVTIAMGADARKIAQENITENSSLLIITKHPAVRDNTFGGCNCFIDCNNKLIENSLKPIKWTY